MCALELTVDGESSIAGVINLCRGRMLPSDHCDIAQRSRRKAYISWADLQVHTLLAPRVKQSKTSLQAERLGAG